MVGAPSRGERRRIPGPAVRRQALLNAYPFVFIHIRKTGGTSIRTALGIGSVPNHITAREMRRIFPDSCGKFAFGFVRNPWDRLVSWVHRMGLGVDWDQPDRFDQLGLEPQVDYLLDEDGKLMVDFVGRFENLAEDFNTICGKIGIATPPLPHLNTSEHRHYRDYYDETAKQFIAKQYAEDIERFGYSF